MAINEKIVTGRKFRRLLDKDSKLWQLISWWTKASDVEFDDGKTAEQKVGNINGITSDFSVNDERIAASSNLTNRAYERFNEFTDDGKIKRIIIGDDGKPYIEYEDGADTVLKKLGNNGTVMYLGSGTYFDVSKVYDDYKNLTVNNFVIEVSDFSANSSPAVQITGDHNLFSHGKLEIEKKYNSSTGKLSAKATLTSSASFSEAGTTGSRATNVNAVKAYLIVLPD